MFVWTVLSLSDASDDDATPALKVAAPLYVPYVPCFAVKKTLSCIPLHAVAQTAGPIAATQSMGSTHRLLSCSLGAPILRWRYSSQLLVPC